MRWNEPKQVHAVYWCYKSSDSVALVKAVDDTRFGEGVVVCSAVTLQQLAQLSEVPADIMHSLVNPLLSHTVTHTLTQVCTGQRGQRSPHSERRLLTFLLSLPLGLIWWLNGQCLAGGTGLQMVIRRVVEVISSKISHKCQVKCIEAVKCIIKTLCSWKKKWIKQGLLYTKSCFWFWQSGKVKIIVPECENQNLFH